MKAHICTILLLATFELTAGEVEILDAQVVKQGNSYRFDVTLRHRDTGWEHYADAWEIFAPDGTSLGKRVLFHPHVNEQPFTRSLPGVNIPLGTPYVEIGAHDKVHGDSSVKLKVKIP